MINVVSSIGLRENRQALKTHFQSICSYLRADHPWGLLSPKLQVSGSPLLYDKGHTTTATSSWCPALPLRASLAVNQCGCSQGLHTNLPLSLISSTRHKIIVERCGKLSLALKKEKKKITKYPCVCLKLAKGVGKMRHRWVSPTTWFWSLCPPYPHHHPHLSSSCYLGSFTGQCTDHFILYPRHMLPASLKIQSVQYFLKQSICHRLHCWVSINTEHQHRKD